MCYSAPISILTFVIGIMGSIVCISLGSIDDKIIGSFIGFVASMQLIEYLLWNHQTCDEYNILLSRLGMALNHLQPIVLGFLILLFNTKLQHTNIVLFSMIIYSVSMIPYSMEFLQDTKSQCTKKGDDSSHLLWNWNRMKYSTYMYGIFLVTMCILFYYGLTKINFSVFAIDTAILTYVTTGLIYPSKYIGTIWCFYTMFIPILYIAFRVRLE